MRLSISPDQTRRVRDWLYDVKGCIFLRNLYPGTDNGLFEVDGEPFIIDEDGTRVLCTDQHGQELDFYLKGEASPDEEPPTRWERTSLICGKRRKDGKACLRSIVGVLETYSGYFEHKKFGTCDLRNQEWRCWQHHDVGERGQPHDHDDERR